MLKRVRIMADQVALIFKEGKLQEVLTPNNYWRWHSNEVEILEVNKPFKSKYDVDLLLKYSFLKDMLDIIEVKDNEICLQYVNKQFCQVLTAGRYIYWKDVKDYSYQFYDMSNDVFPNEINGALLTYPAILAWIRVYTVAEFEKGLLYIDGVFQSNLNSGTYFYWKNGKSIMVYKTDIRVQQMEVSGQELLTKDKASLRINFFADFQVNDITKYLVESKDSGKQFYLLMQLALREYIGRYTLDEVLASKQEIGEYVKEATMENAAKMGIALQVCGIRDIILPGDIKEIMNQVLLAEKKAQANMIMRREETASTRSLLNTAKLMEENEMLFKLKEMEYVGNIAENIQNITLSGGSQLVDQLKTIFSVSK